MPDEYESGPRRCDRLIGHATETTRHHTKDEADQAALLSTANRKVVWEDTADWCCEGCCGTEEAT